MRGAAGQLNVVCCWQCALPGCGLAAMRLNAHCMLLAMHCSEWHAAESKGRGSFDGTDVTHGRAAKRWGVRCCACCAAALHHSRALPPCGFAHSPDCAAMPRLPSKVAFCNFIVKLHKSADKSRLKPNTFVFKVDPRMTKTEVKEYFRKVYQLEPTKVGTVNYDGVRRPACCCAAGCVAHALSGVGRTCRPLDALAARQAVQGGPIQEGVCGVQASGGGGRAAHPGLGALKRARLVRVCKLVHVTFLSPIASRSAFAAGKTRVFV